MGMYDFYKVVRKYMLGIIITILCVAFILLGMSNIIPSQKSINTIVADSILTIFFGWCINLMFVEQGHEDGLNSEDIINVNNALADEYKKIEHRQNLLSVYCAVDNNKVLRIRQTEVLRKANIKYDDFISSDFDFFPVKTNEKGKIVKDKFKRRIIKKALHCKAGNLTKDWLINKIDVEIFRNIKHINLTKHKIYKNLRSLISKCLIGFISSFYILEAIIDPNWAMIIWRTFQVALFLAFGFTSRMSEYSFITREYRQEIIARKNVLCDFRIWLEDFNEENYKDFIY